MLAHTSAYIKSSERICACLLKVQELECSSVEEFLGLSFEKANFDVSLVIQKEHHELEATEGLMMISYTLHHPSLRACRLPEWKGLIDAAQQLRRSLADLISLRSIMRAEMTFWSVMIHLESLIKCTGDLVSLVASNNILCPGNAYSKPDATLLHLCKELKLDSCNGFASLASRYQLVGDLWIVLNDQLEECLKVMTANNSK
jgi:hypothetical protein